MDNRPKKLPEVSRFIAAAIALLFTLPTVADTPVPVVDPSSAYKPTAIVNGSFDTEPWMSFTFNGTRYTSCSHNGSMEGACTDIAFNGIGGGWNTSEYSCWRGNLFEYTSGQSVHNYQHNVNISLTDRYIEMNNVRAAVMYQDLVTYGGDVIRWTLKHGIVTNGDATQPMRVEIGVTPRDAGGAVVNESATGSSIETKIPATNKAIYRNTGVTDSSGATSTIGFGGSDIANLSLSKSTQSDKWYQASGVYVMPDGQDVSRFAFVSEAVTPNCGNLLDDITFSTLIGNLGAVANADGSVKVTGYWGDADSTKRLCVKSGSTVLDLDMSGVLNKNFTVTIPAATIGDAAQIEVYHQDYVQARRTVKVVHPRLYAVIASGELLKAYCTNAAHAAAGSGCDHAGEANAISLGLLAHNAPYTGAPYNRARATGGTNELTSAGLPQPTITYAVRGSADYSPTAPTAAGLYTARMTLGGASVTSDFDIMAITAGEFEQVSSDLVRLPVRIDGSMTIYSIVPNGTKLRLTQVSGAGWAFRNGVVDKSTSHADPVVDQEYISVQLVIDPAAVTATRSVAAMAEEAFSSVRYGRMVAEVKISGTYAAGLTLRDGDAYLDGHFYTVSSETFYWAPAMEWAFNLMTTDASRYPGFRSYPATITSGEENKLLVTLWIKGGEKQIWLGGVPRKPNNDAVITVTETDGHWTVTRTGSWPAQTPGDFGYNAQFKRSDGTTGTGDIYRWIEGTPEGDADVSMPVEYNTGNGECWHSGEPNGGNLVYFGYGGALWDDMPSDQYYRSIAEWEPIDPETVVTVSDTAKMVPVSFATASEGTTCGGTAFASTNTARKVGSVGGIPVLEKADCTFLGWTTVSGGSPIVEKTSAEIAATDPAIGSAGETWYAVWSDALALGEFVPLKQQFPDVVGTTGNRYSQMTIMLTREKARADETVTLPTVSGYSKNASLSTEYSYVIDISPAKTVAEIATNYLAQIRFLHVVDQEVRVVIGPSVVHKTFYNVDTEHYYQFVSFTTAKTWKQSYADARGMSYAGRRGYLATVTSTNEDVFIYKASSEVGWLGGTRMAPGTKDGQYYDDFNAGASAGHWYWACGPECGKEFFDADTASVTSYEGNVAKGYYFNWNSGEPNNSGSIENCLTTLFVGSGYSTASTISNYSWNDIAWNRNDTSQWMPRGYLVEYGDLPVGDTTDDDPTIASASGYVIAVADIVAPYVAFDAWGGYFTAWESEIVSNVCVDGIYAFPPESSFSRTGYDFGGWYVSWTNGAVQAVAGGPMYVQGPHTLYAKWISKSSPVPEDPTDPTTGDGMIEYEPVATNADGSAVVGAGALVNRATNAFTKTDLAIPEFTSNGPNGIPYVIIRDHAFAYANYDGLRVEESKAAAKAAGKKRPTEAEQHTNCLSSVTISTYVTNIQAYAFAECEVLTNVTFSQTRDYKTGEKAKLVIGDWAFANSSVSSVVFPADTCVELDVGAFADASNLEDIYILGDVSVKGKYPFAGAGRDLYYRTGRTAKVHLSAKLAADPDYVLALTNGMSAVTVVLDQNIVGSVLYSADLGTDPMSFTFSVPDSLPWVKVTEETVYLFWSTTVSPKTFIGNAPIAPVPGSLVKNADGSYTAKFPKPAGVAAAFFQLCIGEER